MKLSPDQLNRGKCEVEWANKTLFRGEFILKAKKLDCFLRTAKS